MSPDKYKLQLDNANAQMRNYRMAMFGSLLAIVVLAFVNMVISGRERTIVVPPELSKSIWVDNNGVSREYLEEMAIYIAQLQMTVTPRSFKFQSEQLLKYIHPSAYGDMKSSHAQRLQELQRDNTSYWFTPRDANTDVAKKQVVILGELVNYVGEKEIQKQQKKYLVEFIYVNSRLYLKTFKEITDDKQKTATGSAVPNS
jgi:conjugal transfer pilus assembly protein TraE